MSTSIAGVGTNYMFNPYGYCSDLTDYDPTYTSYPSFQYNLGMNDSIFGAGYPMAMPMPGCTPGSNQNYFDQMKDYQKFYIDYNVDQQRMSRNADLRINGSMEAIQTTFAVLKDKIMTNEQSQIEEAYNNFVAAVGNAYGNASAQELKARAATIYGQLNGGKSIAQDLREYGHGSFTQGLIHGATFGLYNSKSAEDNISKITGAPVGTGEKISQNVGRLGGAGILGGIAYGIGKACKAGKAGIIGLAVAAGAGIISLITGKVTT